MSNPQEPAIAIVQYGSWATSILKNLPYDR